MEGIRVGKGVREEWVKGGRGNGKGGREKRWKEKVGEGEFDEYIGKDGM